MLHVILDLFGFFREYYFKQKQVISLHILCFDAPHNQHPVSERLPVFGHV